MPHQRAQSKPDYIKWLLLAGGLVLVVAVMGYVGSRLWRPKSAVTIDRHRFPIAGIDVSNHNGDIDFAQVKADNYQFVIAKASEGATYRDRNFARNIRKAKQAGLIVGAYHFFRKNRDGVQQANNLLGAVSDKALDLPLVIDIEDWDNDHFISHETTMQRANDMVNHLKQQGYRVMIYTNGNGYKKYYQQHFSNDCDLWLSSFSHPDKLPSLPHCIQQYSHTGRVKGVDGDVDLNIFRGDERQWQAFLTASLNHNN